MANMANIVKGNSSLVNIISYMTRIKQKTLSTEA